MFFTKSEFYISLVYICISIYLIQVIIRCLSILLNLTEKVTLWIIYKFMNHVKEKTAFTHLAGRLLSGCHQINAVEILDDLHSGHWSKIIASSFSNSPVADGLYPCMLPFTVYIVFGALANSNVLSAML